MKQLVALFAASSFDDNSTKVNLLRCGKVSEEQ
jgi:hypothetical protein